MWPIWFSIVLLGLKYQEPKSKLEIFFVRIETPRLSYSRPRPGQVADPWQCTDQVLLTVDVRCNLVLLLLLFLFFFWGGRGLRPETKTKLADARSRSCCFVHIKPISKVKGLGFRVFNVYQADATSCRHVTPVCRLLV